MRCDPTAEASHGAPGAAVSRIRCAECCCAVLLRCAAASPVTSAAHLMLICE